MARPQPRRKLSEPAPTRIERLMDMRLGDFLMLVLFGIIYLGIGIIILGTVAGACLMVYAVLKGGLGLWG
jgi:hypothetical protein